MNELRMVYALIMGSMGGYILFVAITDPIIFFDMLSFLKNTEAQLLIGLIAISIIATYLLFPILIGKRNDE